MLLLWAMWRENGLYLYNILAIVAGNIQVLKVTPFVFSPEPVALGTLLFATSFTASDILTEHHGPKAAKLGVKLSFAAQFIMTIYMAVTLVYQNPIGDFKGVDDSGNVAYPVQYALYTIFVPSVRILVASLIAYYISQFIDINVFKYIRTATHNRYLWLRTNVSTMASGLIDNIIFSSLAWVILSPDPVSMESLIFTFILGTYGSRVIISITSTPVLYMTYWIKKKY